MAEGFVVCSAVVEARPLDPALHLFLALSPLSASFSSRALISSKLSAL